MPISNSIRDEFEERINRYDNDITHIKNGDFDRVSPKTKVELSDFIKSKAQGYIDQMQGQTRYTVPLSNGFSFEYKKESSGQEWYSLKFGLSP